jgi:dynein heavy chain
VVYCVLQVLYYRAWLQSVEVARSGVNASLLVRHSETGKLFVNFDPQVFEVIAEARYMQKLQLEVPENLLILLQQEATIKANKERLVT